MCGRCMKTGNVEAMRSRNLGGVRCRCTLHFNICHSTISELEFKHWLNLANVHLLELSPSKLHM
jgi:hypothetical protein